MSKFDAIRAAAARRDHGTRARYMAGCKCVPCRAANSRYESERLRARQKGDHNGIVSARRARAHLRKLAKAGIGRRAVAAATDISATILQLVKTGKRKQIRARTERKILAVNDAARGDKSLVDGGPTWKILNELIASGYTRTLIARWLGSKAKMPKLQVAKHGWITARTRGRVRRLAALLKAGKLRRA